MTREPKIRELRVTDIRCHTEGCGAGPGAPCRFLGTSGPRSLPHQSRFDEHAELVAAGYQWQEPDPKDDGAGREEREAARQRNCG